MFKSIYRVITCNLILKIKADNKIHSSLQNVRLKQDFPKNQVLKINDQKNRIKWLLPED